MRIYTTAVLVFLLLIAIGCGERKEPESGPGPFSGDAPTGTTGTYRPLAGDENVKNSEVAYNLALEFAAKGNQEAAYHYINLAIKLQPAAKYSHAKGLLLLSEERYQEALTLFLQALHQGAGDPNNEVAINNAIGVCYMQLNNPDQALEFFRKVVNAPGIVSRFEAYYNMGKIYMEQGKNIDAEYAFLKVIQENPGFYKAHMKMGQVFMAKEDYEQAAQYFQNSLDIIAGDYRALNVDGAEIHYYLAEALYRLQRYPEAYTQLVETLKISPEGPYGQRAKEMIQNLEGDDQ